MNKSDFRNIVYVSDGRWFDADENNLLLDEPTGESFGDPWQSVSVGEGVVDVLGPSGLEYHAVSGTDCVGN